MTDQPVITEVVGGSHGLVVQHERARALASAYDASGNRLRGWAGDDAKITHDGDLVESSVLSPLTFAEAEARVAAATAGPHGAFSQSVAWEADALVVRGVVSAFEESDALIAAGLDALDYSVGRMVGTGLGLAAPGLALGGLAIWAGTKLPPWLIAPPARVAGDRAARWAKEWAAEDALTWVQHQLEVHPGVGEHLFNGTGGLVDGFWTGLTHQGVIGPDGRPLSHPRTVDAAGLMVGLFPPDGDPVVTGLPPRGLPTDVTDPTPATSLRSLLTNLQHVSDLSPGADSPLNGTIAISTFDGPDGPRHIVYLPGTDDLTSMPWSTDDDLRDTLTNLRAVGDQETAYSQGVLESMRRAGVGVGEPVLLVGHSQGGIVAHYLAQHPGEFTITDAVTAASPIGAQAGNPTGAHVLSLENTADLVPVTDGADNAPDPHHTTVRFTSYQGSVEGNHLMPAYVEAGGQVDASADPSVHDALARLRAQGYLDGGSGSTTVWQIARDSGPDHRPAPGPDGGTTP